jgi:signal transduction histidine kinase
VLSVSGIWGVSSYRGLARTVSHRAAELPLAADVTGKVAGLRITYSRFRPQQDTVRDVSFHNERVRFEFDSYLMSLKDALKKYEEQLEQNDPNGSGIGDNRKERNTLSKVHRLLASIEDRSKSDHWMLAEYADLDLTEELTELDELARELPRYLHDRMQHLKGNVRGEYHTLIALTWTTSILSIVMLGVLVRLFWVWIVAPSRILLHGSRKVAGGDLAHRIRLDSHDEMAELANAMNEMTERFCEIRDDLDQQVKDRTQEVVRSEQLASVGFLAAGVAHEINNPLASIAWSAEALEGRLHDILYADDLKPDGEQNEELTVLRTYLRRIQDEAFRCKGITEKLLDFSRIGDVQRLPVDIHELTSDVIEMVRHLGSYKNKHISFEGGRPVLAIINAQEIKQVVLNLLTNALDSLDDDGTVAIRLDTHRGHARLTVRDDGCGMTEEVRKHLFEPFFTRRRGGQGTGLGLSITYRIVSDHGGKIEATSDGPGNGSQFCVLLPLAENHHENETDRQRQVA